MLRLSFTSGSCARRCIFAPPGSAPRRVRPTRSNLERGPGSRGRSQNNNIEHKRNKHRKVHDSAARKPSRPPTPPHISDTICTSRRSLAYSLLHLPTYVALQSSRSRRSTACPSMLTVRPTPLPPIHCTSWIMRTPLVLQWGFTVGSCCRDLGPWPCGQTILELGDVISCAPPRPRRCDLVCSSAALGLHHADDACPPETCAQQISMRSRRDLDAYPPETCAQPPGGLPPGDLCPARARRHRDLDRDLDPTSDALSRMR